MNWRRILGVLLACLLGAATAFAQSTPDSPAARPLELADFAGKYPFEVSECANCGAERFELDSFGTAARTDVSIMGTRRLEGRATLDEGLLTIQWDGRGSEKWKQAPKTETFLAVPWGERRYLVRPDELVKFCEAIRVGVEPRSHVDGSPYLRAGDERRSVRGLPALAETGCSRFAEESLEARLVRVDGSEAEVELINGAVPPAGTLLFLFSAPTENDPIEAVRVRTLPTGDGSVRVRWAEIDNPWWRPGECISTRFVFNRWAYPLELRCVGRGRDGSGPFVLNTDFLVPLPDAEDRYAAALEAAQRLVGSGTPIDSRAKPELDEIPIDELTPALLNAALLIPVNRRSTLVQVARLVSYWDERQRGIQPLEFDIDLDRLTPQAQGERLQVLHDWAEWWRATAADPVALAEWRAAVRGAGGH